ncbi:radical SAM family heme chaperone HemW [Oscillospiraceae bacterium WX1]
MDKYLGVYIHIPFCAGKCAYCDFYSLSGHEKLMPVYQHALLSHIREYGPQLDGYLTDTIYFGGGTPSIYGSDRLIALFDALKKYGHVLLDAEVTTEVNPASITKADLLRLRRAGFNRLSIGVQSANDALLKSLGRKHTFADAEETVKNAREAGFDNISIDLIYGLPSQTRDDWADTLGRAAALKPEHISCYGLKIEEGSQLYIYKDSPFLPDDDTQADMYLYAVETLSRFGLKQYEISNFARRSYESRHNMKYWFGDEYLGFGAAAHSYIGGKRYNHIADLEKYSDNIIAGRPVVDMTEEISGFELAGEYLMLRLRTTHGISEKEYYDIYPCSMDSTVKLLRFYESKGWASFSEGRWSFTPLGFLLSNTLIGQILETQTKQRSGMTKPWEKPEALALRTQLTLFENTNKEVQMFRGI